MKKTGLLIVTGAMIVASGSLVASHVTALPERDTRIIVEVNRNIEKLSKNEVRNTQDVVYNNIKQYATDNIRLVQRYDELNNAFVLKVNSNDVEKIKTVPGVASVTVDKLHWTQVYNDDGYVPLGNDDSQEMLGENDNISAATMKKPEDTNDGEGTIVAILDNEFHLRGTTRTAEAWHHEVYDPLPEGTKVKYTFQSISAISGLKANSRNPIKEPGEEGSEYFNNKVPFYFDYGGTKTDYAKDGTPKFDVHSDLSYHGSHVSSITAANAPEYKGIAPKAQLALMKVFTEFNSKGMGDELGIGTSSGAYDSVILNALEDCIKLDVDGINMSLGSDLDDFDSDSITLKTLTRLSEKGILSAISAGNSGKSSFAFAGAYGNWGTEMVETGIMSSYANNASTMTIASGHPTQIFYENAFQIAGKNVAFEDQIVNREGFDDDYDEEFRMKDIYHDEPLEWVYIPGFGSSADYGDTNVEGKIVIVNRGSTTFADKYNTAVDKGASAVVIINNDPTASDFNFRCSFGDGFNPTVPCALVLYKDKALFEQQKQGTFTLINKQVSDNPYKYTASNFSTDGATYNLDLKPEITAPGDNIKGAVPEHAMTSLTKEEREAVKYKAYQYLSGTSMSAPNYAGAQSVVLSEEAPGHIDRLSSINSDSSLTTEAKKKAIQDENDAYVTYRKTVDMRLMSTADPMTDGTENPETNVKSPISPRIQGAGMVDLGGALSTDVYLEGLDLAGNKIGKSKIALRNNPDIAKGDIKLSFIAHNESQEARQYDVKFNVLRPAIAHPNNLLSKDYNDIGEIDSISALPGASYFDKDLEKMAVGRGEASYKDAVNISKDIEYYASEADYRNDKKTTIAKGYYYNSATEGIDWQPLPSYAAQSTQDVVIAEVTRAPITIQPGESRIDLDVYSLTDEAKKAILDTYNYGCMIEGFVTLTSKNNQPDLSIPYLGFYSGTDKDASASYSSAPIMEPFNFEKDPTRIYPSDYVNDITKSLIGRDNVNFESMIVAGYAEKPEKIDTDKVLENNQSFDKLTGFYKVGTNPINDDYTENPSNDIYVGNPETTNTMIIQQFVLRSVDNNYFTITKKGEDKAIYTSALEDMLFSDRYGKWCLYKSHVDAGYLSAGYVAHRAYAIVPLYDETTGRAFESGEYELKFNYKLAASGEWVSKSYTLHIDSDAPIVNGISQYKKDGVDRVRIYFQEDKLAYGLIGYSQVEAKYDEEKQMYYLDETKEFIDEAVREVSGTGKRRLFIGSVDYARGYSGAIVHPKDESDYMKGVEIVQGANINANVDYTYTNGTLTFVDSLGKPVNIEGKVLMNGFELPVTAGCAGGIEISIISMSAFALIVFGVLLIERKRKKGVR